MIHVIGDSHNGIFKLLKEPAINMVDTKITAHNIAFKKDIWLEMIAEVDKIEDKLILSFGEIDCRFHICYQHKKFGHNVDDIIDETIWKYSKLFKFLNDYDYAVYLLRPPGFWDDINPPPAESGYKWDCPKPFRPYIYSQFHDKLKKCCVDNNIKFIDVWEETVDSEGYMKKEYRINDYDPHFKYSVVWPIVLPKLRNAFLDVKFD